MRLTVLHARASEPGPLFAYGLHPIWWPLSLCVARSIRQASIQAPDGAATPGLFSSCAKSCRQGSQLQAAPVANEGSNRSAYGLKDNPLIRHLCIKVSRKSQQMRSIQATLSYRSWLQAIGSSSQHRDLPKGRRFVRQWALQIPPRYALTLVNWPHKRMKKAAADR